MQVDVNMSKSFNILYSGGMRAEYDIGTFLPTDDVRAQASKSLEAYSYKTTEVRVELKNANGFMEYKYKIDYGRTGATWLYSGFTAEDGGSDTAEYVVYNFNGYTIRHY